MAQRSQPRPPSHPRAEDDGKRPETENRIGASLSIDLPVGTTFSLLRNSRRRAVVEYLARTERSASVSEITRAATAAEHDIPTEHVTDRQQKCVYVSLLQVHLPALVAEGVIEWDEPAGVVEGKQPVGALAGMVDLVEKACGPDGN